MGSGNLLSIRESKTAFAFLILITFYSFCLPYLASGQSSEDVDPEFSGAKQNVAEVRVDGNFLFYIRGISSYPAELRAETISKRIKKIGTNSAIAADSIKIIPGEGQLKIYAGNEFIMSVLPVDVETEGISQGTFARLVCTKITGAINSYRHDRTTPVLISKALHAIGAAILLSLLLYILFRLIRKVNSSLQNKIKVKVDSVDNKSYKLIRSSQLWKVFDNSFKVSRVLVTIVIIAVFLQYILGLFPWTNNLASSTIKLFLNPLQVIWKGFTGFLPGLIFLFIIFLITRYFLKLIKLLFIGIDHGAIVIKNFYPDWAMPTFRILRIFIIAFAVIVAYPYIPGSGSSAFKGVSVFLGVLFSIGSTSFIGNIIAGYSMTYRRAFKIGDRIEVDDHIGFVEEQKLLVTRLRSHKNEEIIIPNSILLNSHIINYSAKVNENENGLILHTMVGIGYETPWRQVDAMLKLAAERTEGLLKDPPPFVLKKSLGDFAVNYEINVYCKDTDRINRYYTELHQNILDVFNENDVQIMTPAYRADPEEPKVVPIDQWNKPLAGSEE
jgi:small-conductance mechanosensitive channel